MSEITVWTMVEYLAGIFGIVMGLISMILRPMVGIPLVLAGLVAVPRIRNSVEDKTNIELTNWTVVGVYLSLFAVGILFFYML